MTVSIRTRGLSRLFAGGHGVQDLDLEVPGGCVYGFLGPNGAGKTTTIRLLLGLLRAQRGSIELHGLPLDPRHRGALARTPRIVPMPSTSTTSGDQRLLLVHAHPDDESIGQGA